MTPPSSIGGKPGIGGKLMSLSEAVTRFAHDGAQVALGGFTINRNPMAFVYEMVRQRCAACTSWPTPTARLSTRWSAPAA